jgi:hypothetical protein
MNIEREGHTFTPRYNDSGEMIANAEEVYREWLEQKNRPPEPTEEERIGALEAAMLDLILGGAE